MDDAIEIKFRAWLPVSSGWVGVIRDVRPRPFRYLDNPIILADGEVLRFPYIAGPSDAYGPGSGSGVHGMRLYKRRRRCRACHHRHGPTRNLAAKICACRTSSGPCGCRIWSDWPTPEQALTRSE